MPACSDGVTGLLEAETSSRAAQLPAPDPLPTSLSEGWGAGAGAQAQSCQTTNTHIWKKFPSQPDFPLSYFCLFGNSGRQANGGSEEVKGGEWAQASLPPPQGAPLQPPQYPLPDHIPPPCSCRSRLLVTIFWGGFNILCHQACGAEGLQRPFSPAMGGMPMEQETGLFWLGVQEGWSGVGWRWTWRPERKR